MWEKNWFKKLHIGQHILLGNLTTHSNTCGFCGGLTCQIKIILSSGSGVHKTFAPHSNCTFFYKFNLKSAEKVSARTPCTNRPVSCSICSETYWSCNLKQHYLEKHYQQIYEVHQISQEENEKVSGMDWCQIIGQNYHWSFFRLSRNKLDT